MPARITYLIIALIAALLFLPFLGHVHLFDWDEINFAECAREMIVSKDYLRMQIDFIPFYEKPPLFIWMEVLSMSALGINEYAARLPDALTGIATLLTLYYAGSRVRNRVTGLWWTVMYAATWLPHIYFKSGIIDPVFNYFIFLAFFQVWLVKWGTRKTLHALLAGLFLALAVLTKGPVAIIVSGIALVVFAIAKRGLHGYKWHHFLLIALVAAGTMSIWFGAEVVQHGWTFLREFIAYQAGLFGQNIAGHEEPWFYHPIVLLIGCFPASLFLFQWSRKQSGDEPQTRDFTRWMWMLFWVVLILFSIVKTKIIHYSSLCYYPVTYVAALQIAQILEGRRRLKRGVQIGLLAIGSIFALAIAALPLVGLFKAQVIPYIRDQFAVLCLGADVHWHWAECLIGGIYLAGIWICVLMMRRHFRRGLIALCVLQVLAIQITAVHFTPKVEAYSQRAAIEFFQSFDGKDVYVHPLGYKSYAHLFYSRKQRSDNPAYYHTVHSEVGASDIPEPNEQWLLYGKIDKPAFFIAKIEEGRLWRTSPALEEIGEKNGFVFFRRKKL
jgi:4-amino-4-deoxy-L-arabinose transferase-like glycosyltransferase